MDNARNISLFLFCGTFIYQKVDKQHGKDKVCSRLDRAFGIIEWMMQWDMFTLNMVFPLSPTIHP